MLSAKFHPGRIYISLWHFPAPLCMVFSGLNENSLMISLLMGPSPRDVWTTRSFTCRAHNASWHWWMAPWHPVCTPRVAPDRTATGLPCSLARSSGGTHHTSQRTQHHPAVSCCETPKAWPSLPGKMLIWWTLRSGCVLASPAVLCYISLGNSHKWVWYHQWLLFIWSSQSSFGMGYMLRQDRTYITG